MVCLGTANHLGNVARKMCEVNTIVTKYRYPGNKWHCLRWISAIFILPPQVSTDKELLVLNLLYIVYPPQGHNYHNYIIWLLTMATDCESRAQEVWCDILAKMGRTEGTWTQGREKFKETLSSAVHLQALRRTLLLSHRRCCSSLPWPGHNPWSPHTFHHLNKA